MEARVGFELLSPIDVTQLIHSTTRQKRQNGQISRIEVHAGYTAERMPRPFVFSGKKNLSHTKYWESTHVFGDGYNPAGVEKDPLVSIGKVFALKDTGGRFQLSIAMRDDCGFALQ